MQYFLVPDVEVENGGEDEDDDLEDEEEEDDEGNVSLDLESKHVDMGFLIFHITLRW